jgi:transcriptional regulator with XRE-family HTH domain
VHVGRTIQIVRNARQMRLLDLAQKSGVSVPFLSLVENGDRQPSLDVLGRIASSLGIPLDALLLVASRKGTTLRTNNAGVSRLTDCLSTLLAAEDALRAHLQEISRSAAKRIEA